MSVQEMFNVTMERTLPAPPEAVFDALTQADQIVQWFGPTSLFPITEMDVELRDGGGYFISLQMGEEVVTVRGTYLEITPHSRLRFTWQWEGSVKHPHDTEVTFDLKPEGSGTHLTLTHAGFRDSGYRDEHNSGWVSGLNRLMQHVSGISGVVNQATMTAGNGHRRFTTTLSFVPDDQFDWTPAEGAKTAHQIAAHVAVSNVGFARLLSGEDPGFDDFGSRLEEIAALEAELNTRDKVEEALEDSYHKLIKVMESLTPERLGAAAKLPFGDLPIAALLFFPGVHYQSHAGQIDYLQTCWGDPVFHI